MQEVKIENGGRHLAGSCGVNVDERVGAGGLRARVVILMDSSINRDLYSY